MLYFASEFQIDTWHVKKEYDANPMTIVIGLIDPETKAIHIGADTVGSNGNRYVYRNTKVWGVAVNEKEPATWMAIGVSGSYRAGQIIQTMTVPNWDGSDAYLYLIGPFATAVRQALVEGGEMGKNGDQRDETSLDMLVALDGRLFTIWYDFSVTEAVENYAVIGSGSDLALGSLYTTIEHEISPAYRIRQALLTAAHYNQSCGAPFDMAVLADGRFHDGGRAS
jgi:hypothetical protein